MNRAYRLLAISSVIVFIIITHYVGWISVFEDFLRQIITPGSQSVYKWSLSIQGNEPSFSTVSELEHAYIGLREELNNVSVRAANVDVLKLENRELKDQLHYFANHQTAHIGAEVIGKNIESVGSTVVINRGKDEGVSVGDPVVVGDGILAGKILRVLEHTSVVRLLTDNQSKVAATILNTDHSIGLVEGGYDISVQMNFIPQNETVSVGDVIVTSGLEPDIPRGLLIGKVRTVSKEIYQPFQQAILSPTADLQKLFLVSVILSDKMASST